jgi:hypothetical protein
MISTLFCLPMFLYGGWMLSLWIMIQVRRCVYLEYPYLPIGVASVVLCSVALLCVLQGAKRRGYWRLLFMVPVVMGLWAMIVIPNIAPFDAKSATHVFEVANQLDSFGKARGRFPQDENELERWVPAAAASSPYGKDGRELSFRVVLIANASGPQMGGLGNDPGVTLYGLSSDRRDVWLSQTELEPQHPVGNHVRLVEFLSLDGFHKAIHLRVGQVPSEE